MRRRITLNLAVVSAIFGFQVYYYSLRLLEGFPFALVIPLTLVYAFIVRNAYWGLLAGLLSGFAFPLVELVPSYIHSRNLPPNWILLWLLMLGFLCGLVGLIAGKLADIVTD